MVKTLLSLVENLIMVSSFTSIGYVIYPIRPPEGRKSLMVATRLSFKLTSSLPGVTKSYLTVFLSHWNMESREKVISRSRHNFTRVRYRSFMEPAEGDHGE